MTPAPPRMASAVALAAVLRPADVRDVQPVRAEPLKHGPLVRFPAPEQILEPDVELPRRPQLPPRPQQVQPRQLPARKEVGDITSRQPNPALDDLHLDPLPVGHAAGVSP